VNGGIAAREYRFVLQSNRHETPRVQNQRLELSYLISITVSIDCPTAVNETAVVMSDWRGAYDVR
jgi:hypothetical protein